MYLCESTDDGEPTVSNLSVQKSVYQPACGTTQGTCPNLLTVESQSFFIGPIGFSLNNKILSCVR
jgi:hypothetical protein